MALTDPNFRNSDTQKPFKRWTYVIAEQSFRPSAVEAIGVGSADAVGQTSVVLFDPSEAAN